MAVRVVYVLLLIVFAVTVIGEKTESYAIDILNFEDVPYENQEPIVHVDIVALRDQNRGGGSTFLIGTFNVSEDVYADDMEGEGTVRQWNGGWKDNFLKWSLPSWCPSKASRKLETSSDLVLGPECIVREGEHVLHRLKMDDFTDILVGQFMEYGLYESSWLVFKKANDTEKRQVVLNVKMEVEVKASNGTRSVSS